jgi:hypothetical protein
VTGEDGIILQEMAVDPTQKQSLKDQLNYIRAINFLCKMRGSRQTCTIHEIERLNRYYGVPLAFREIFPRYKVKYSFKFRICQYIAEISELTYNSK